MQGPNRNRMTVLILATCTALLGIVGGRNINHDTRSFTEETVDILLQDLQGRPVTSPFSPHGIHNPHRHRRASSSSSVHPGGEGLRLALLSSSSPPLHLLLHHTGGIVAPSARMEWYDRDSNDTMSRALNDGCLFQAMLENKTLYGGFLNLCDGITGVIETPDDEVYIVPVGGGRQGALTGRHVLRHHWKQSQGAGHRCGTDSMQDFRQDVDESTSTHASPGQRYRRDLYRRGPKYIEVLLATDMTVEDYHGHELMEQYLLTQLSIVNQAYQHESIGVDIRIVVNRIIIIPTEKAEEIVEEKTGKSVLDKFCRWINYEQQLRFTNEQPHDLAVYITRQDIGPAGYAPVTGMCNPSRSCTVNKDDGISSAFVIAHEMGHVLGLQHDGIGNDCEDDPDDGKIMAALVQASYDKYYWTTCSRDRLARYIDHYHCLDNEPVAPKTMDFVEPYGQSWSLDEQCRQEFGEDFQLCEAFAHLDPCEYLWCSTRQNPGLCRTKRGPPLPGTKCAGEKWCMGGRCVWIDNTMVDGGWSDWGYWTDCSRTCGTGVKYRRRTCNNPYPQNGGDDCQGDAEEFEICNRFSCGGVPVDFRAEQCTWLNHLELINNQLHTWLPLENKNVSQLCHLTCISMETGDIIVTEEHVIDGTQCSYEIPNDICIEGKCQALGCDGVPNSVAREDQCGVCMGRHDRCGHETGFFDTRLVKDNYYKILTIPRGARDIFIQEMQSSSIHILAVKDPITGHFFFNGNGQKGYSRQFVYQGTRFVYITRSVGETLAARGPLIKQMSVLVHSKSNKIPVQVAWRFIVPNELKGRVYMEQYHEDLALLNPTTPRPTTTTPEPPRRGPVIEKKQDHGGESEQTTGEKEHSKEEENRVEKVEKVVPTDPPVPKKLYKWTYVDWSQCSRSCGEGEQQSGPICASAVNDHLVADVYCQNVPNPGLSVRKCEEAECRTISPYRWVAEEWSPCTETCGRDGSQARRVHCMHNYFGQDYPVDPAQCPGGERPDYYQRCNEFPCVARWRRGPWMKCSVTCGSGRQQRRVICGKPDHNTYKCKGPRPHTMQACHMSPCPVPTTTTAPTTTTRPTTTATTEPPTTTAPVTTKPTTITTTTTTTTTRPPSTVPTTTTTTTPATTPTTTTPPTTTPTTTTTQKPTTTAPTNPRPPPTTPTQPPQAGAGARGADTCTKDKSFFCKMAKARNCHLPLYSSFCCASCREYNG